MPKIVDRDAKCEELTRAAIEAIAEHGLESVKLSDVARIAGVTTGTLGYYFRDKEELLIETLNTVARDILQRMRNLGPIKPDSLQVYLPLTPKLMKQWKVWLAYAGASPSSPKLSKAYREFYADIEALYADILDETDPEIVRVKAGNIIAALDGIGLCAVLQPQLWPAERQINAYKALVEPLMTTKDR